MIACKSPQVFCSIRKTSISCLRLLLLGPSSNSTILIIRRRSISLQINFEIKFLLTGHGTLVACKVRIPSPGQAELQGHLFSLDTRKVLERMKRRDYLTLQISLLVRSAGLWQRCIRVVERVTYRDVTLSLLSSC